MKNYVLNLVEIIRTSFWFLPAVLILAGTAFAQVSLYWDEIFFESGSHNLPRWLFTGGADSARTILSVVASSMATAISLVTSMTMVTFTLASSQYGPRLLRNFIAAQKSQLILGMFMASFIFSITILRVIKSTEETNYVPEISVTISVILGVISFVLLIYLIHYVAVSLRVEMLVASVSDELIRSVERVFPDEIETGGLSRDELYEMDEQKISELKNYGCIHLTADKGGYIQSVNYDELADICLENGVMVQIHCRPGHFVMTGQILADVYFQEKDQTLDEDIQKQMRGDFTIGKNRTPTQDIEFSIDQLIEVTLVALSPGVNKTYTAIACIDRLGEAVSTITQRYIPSAYQFKNDVLCLINYRSGYREIINAAFDKIRQNSTNNPAVAIHLMRTIEKIIPLSKSEEAIQALEEQCDLIVKTFDKDAYAPKDKKDLETVYQRVQERASELNKEELLAAV